MHRLLYHSRTSSGKPTVLLIHGFLEDSSMWSNVLPPDEFDYLAIDLPGHGRSELGECYMPPSISYFTQRILEIIDYYGLTNYQVVGHSMGGYVALDLKSTDQRCKGVILLNSNFWEDSPAKKSDRLRVADLVVDAKDLFIQTAIPSLFSNKTTFQLPIQELISAAKQLKPDGIAYASLAMRNRTTHSELIKEYPFKITMLSGEHDPLMPFDFLQQQCNDLPIKLIPIEHSGHMSHIENPFRTRELLLDILKTK